MSSSRWLLSRVDSEGRRCVFGETMCVPWNVPGTMEQCPEGSEHCGWDRQEARSGLWRVKISFRTSWRPGAMEVGWISIVIACRVVTLGGRNFCSERGRMGGVTSWKCWRNTSLLCAVTRWWWAARMALGRSWWSGVTEEVGILKNGESSESKLQELAWFGQ